MGLIHYECCQKSRLGDRHIQVEEHGRTQGEDGHTQAKGQSQKTLTQLTPASNF